MMRKFWTSRLTKISPIIQSGDMFILFTVLDRDGREVRVVASREEMDNVVARHQRIKEF